MEAFIGKIQSISGNHWHGGLSTAVFFAGCDYNCPNCNAAEILLTKEEYLMDLKEIKKIIRDNLSTIKAVVFTGGEPCLQRQALLSLASFSKDLNLKTGIETNGSKTECIRSLLHLNLIDKISLDLKAPFKNNLFEKATKSKTFFKTTDSLIDDLRCTLKLLKAYEKKINLEIKTTLTPTLISRKEDLEDIGKEIEHLDCTWVLQQFNPANVKHKMFSNLNPPSFEFLENLKDLMQKKFPKIRVIVDSKLF